MSTTHHPHTLVHSSVEPNPEIEELVVVLSREGHSEHVLQELSHRLGSVARQTQRQSHFRTIDHEMNMQWNTLD